MSDQSTPQSPFVRLCDRFGIPPALFWGFVGLLIFMIGDGVELGYLSPYLSSRGMDESRIATVFTLYGVTVGISSWLAGALSNLWGPKRVMLLGLIIWSLFEALFLIYGLKTLSYSMILLTYGLRGFGYPLFAYGFLVWIAAATPSRKMGLAVGWFWVAYAAGLPTLGSLVASFAIPLIGALNTFWLSFALVVLGGIVGLVGLREAHGMRRLAPEGERPLVSMAKNVTIMWHRPKVTLAGVVRIINTSSMFGFLVVLPGFFMHTVGFTLEQWLRLLTIVFVFNIIGNITSSVVSTRLGYRNTILWLGAIGSTVSTPLFFFMPQMFPHNFLLASLFGAFYGLTLACFVPLSALAPALAPQNKAAALSVLSLGAGASTWVGPAVVAIFSERFGLAGVVWAFTGLYALSAVLMLFLKDPEPVHEPLYLWQRLTKTQRRVKVRAPRLDTRWAHAARND
ncbi:MFS transporter [Pseudomonas sp. HR96]|uniref:MFS transporter n=1 Tax=Pseudomonas sp. HR96 TaxID=1027966 RepID=UPI002A756A02|nr:MFS transporter [Pseudomonas sp. HR96]WPP02005.1 MFS transporter [Pseudomonas sp. HR96]